MTVPEVRRLRTTAGGARLAAALLIAAVALSACTGSDVPPPPPQSSPPASPAHEPIAAVVSTCTGPSGASGKTEFDVAYRMKGVTDPIHLVHVNGFAAYQGSTPVNVTPGAPTKEQTGPEDHQTFSGPPFDRLVLSRLEMRVDGQQTVHADSVVKLEGVRFRGPFGPARITTVRVNGQRVAMKVSSPKRAAAGVQSLGPQDATLQVGSATLSLKESASGPEGSQNVNQFTFEGQLPAKGAATLTTSTWKILDFGDMTIALPASC